MSGRVVVAMSGGVDSSVAAALLHSQGYEVIGVGLRLPEMGQAGVVQGACCGIAGMEDATRVAAQIGIPFYVLNYEEHFEREVIGPFVRAYAAGQTPNPCVLCNARIKFGVLLSTALALGAEHLATGHYAQVTREAGGEPRLRRALDAGQDQTYFLYDITQAQLSHILFPLGTLRKQAVREMARQRGLHVSDKPGSQDICFVPGGDYRAFMARRWPAAFQPGPIVDRHGRVLGEHAGVAAFTVGQRKGLRVAAGTPLYVQAIHAATHEVVVGCREEAAVSTLRVGGIRWLAGPAPAGSIRLSVKTRYRSPDVPADVAPLADGGAEVYFCDPQPAVAPGQSAVFYDGDLVVGGGVVLA